MFAAYTPAYGPPAVLELREVAEVPLAAGAIRVAVRASPVTRGDLRLRAADFPGVLALVGRGMFGILAPRAPVQGSMFAGEVVEVGPGVTAFAVGDRVFGEAMAGAWAERLVISASGPVARIPAELSYDEAAALPYGAGTALTFLHRMAAVQPGERVLILGGGGGVGRYAIQVAKALGAHVTAVASAAKLDGMRANGADEVLDYRVDDGLSPAAPYDVVFDTSGAVGVDAMRALHDTGRFLTLEVSGRLLWRMLVHRVTGRGPKPLFAGAFPDQAAMEALADWAADGRVRGQVASSFRLADIVAAHELAERRPDGTVVVRA
jgi:NADPH:quinone reductase-like Zn-dependent oxidoreductase